MKTFKIICLSAILLFKSYGYSAAVTILNDSPFVLTATILSATGEILGRISVTQQQQQTWQDSNQVVDTMSETPFTVVFYCPSGDEYGVVTNVSQSGFVTAQSASGNKVCKIPKQQPGEKPDKQYQGEIYNPKKPINPDQWSENQRY